MERSSLKEPVNWVTSQSSKKVVSLFVRMIAHYQTTKLCSTQFFNTLIGCLLESRSMLFLLVFTFTRSDKIPLNFLMCSKVEAERSLPVETLTSRYSVYRYSSSRAYPSTCRSSAAFFVYLLDFLSFRLFFQQVNRQSFT